MRPFGLFLSVALLGLLVQAAQAGDCGCAASAGNCCDPCGDCCNGCDPCTGKRCELKIGTKIIKVTCYGCECTQKCLPAGPSRKGCTHCEELCGNCGSCGCDRSCDHKPACKVRWTDWCPNPCAKSYRVKKLVKYVAEKEVPDYKWVVVDCCAEGAAPASAGEGHDAPPMPPVPTPVNTTQRRKITRPAPANARVGDVYPLTEAEIKQIESKIQQASHVAPAARVAAKPIATPVKVTPSTVVRTSAVAPVQTQVKSEVPWSLFSN